MQIFNPHQHFRDWSVRVADISDLISKTLAVFINLGDIKWNALLYLVFGWPWTILLVLLFWPVSFVLLLIFQYGNWQLDRSFRRVSEVPIKSKAEYIFFKLRKYEVQAAFTRIERLDDMLIRSQLFRPTFKKEITKAKNVITLYVVDSEMAFEALNNPI